MSDKAKDLIFHLYIVEDGKLTKEAIEIHMENPKVSEVLNGIPYETILDVANTTAKEMNKKIGYSIY